MAELNGTTGRVKVVVDPFANNLLTGEAKAIDANANAFGFLPPPPRGNYDLRLFPGEDAYEQKLIDDKLPPTNSNVFYTANLQLKIDDGEFKGTVLFATVSTRVNDRRGISSVMGLYLIGNPGEKEKYNGKSLNSIEQLQLLATWLKKEPVIKGVLCDWEAYDSDEKKNKGKTMTDFPLVDPQDPSKGHKPEISWKRRDGTTGHVQANLRVKDWTGGTTTESTNSGGTATLASVQVETDPELLAMLTQGGN